MKNSPDKPLDRPAAPAAPRCGRRFLRFLVVLNLVGIAALLSGGVVLRAQSRDFGRPAEIRELQEQNRGLAGELMTLTRSLDGLLDQLLEVRTLEPDARALAGLGSPAASSRPRTRLPAVSDLADRRLAEAMIASAVRLEETLHQARSLRRSFGDVVAGMENQAEVWARVPSTCPLGGGRLTSRFGLRRDPFTGRLAWHRGMDLGAPVGTPVRAPAEGRVIRSGYHGGYGNLVEIDHGNGLRTRYAHNSRVAVRPGEQVRRGQLLAWVGSTGRASAPHLHYEVHLNGESVNPEPYIFNDLLAAD